MVVAPDAVGMPMTMPMPMRMAVAGMRVVVMLVCVIVRHAVPSRPTRSFASTTANLSH